ncbi:MAG TPA: DUF72 domain-containing protein [Alphaproteobacteria bacterium]|nr:DUF72 domain-containing protein [Alphaproteobacteria bacterium]
MARIRIGISGWTYPPWRGVFYPEGLPRRRELEYASRRFGSIEINGTFYGLQKPDAFRRWHAETPDGFVFAVKGSRYITHMKRLEDAEIPLANFFASGLLALGPKLGPLLWQLPPRLRFDEARLDTFLALLPHDTEAAARLARRHDGRLEERAWTVTDLKRPMRHALEVRHDSFRTPRFPELLRRHGVALVFADAVEWPYLEDVTSDLVYLRLHGSEELYASGYSDKALDRWAARVRTWASGREPADAKRVGDEAPPVPDGRDVYVYFDNDAKVRAPFDAAGLMARLGVERQAA